MKTWEKSKNIIAFFKSNPWISTQQVSIFSTVISRELDIYQQFHSSYENPEIKADPYEIIEEVGMLLDRLPKTKITVNLMTNIEQIESERDQVIFKQFVIPLLKSLSDHREIEAYYEFGLDVFSLRGLFDSDNQHIIPEVVNTVIYV